jgi:hypothetical protein
MGKINKLYKITFTVKGNGLFPIDMLRYDRACPLDESASSNIDGRDSREVNLLMFSPTVAGPTEGRWKSFGWNVLPNTVQVLPTIT